MKLFIFFQVVYGINVTEWYINEMLKSFLETNSEMMNTELEPLWMLWKENWTKHQKNKDDRRRNTEFHRIIEKIFLSSQLYLLAKT